MDYWLNLLRKLDFVKGNQIKAPDGDSSGSIYFTDQHQLQIPSDDDTEDSLTFDDNGLTLEYVSSSTNRYQLFLWSSVTRIEAEKANPDYHIDLAEEDDDDLGFDSIRY